ncbi:MutS2 protein [Sulfurihydrogenibium azorense Az-Fu1]|jgi:DNA mismatch repair protein MutS2|uniref:Endonuclease MutS2 n=1 Tax=Sulfurihydrogenibium azorense (strain DSM 15241 / OCM 825 / Az-Fu1) TaxID=204536 RepID=C1DT71_SULAA|nr:endonuclease MutS2 [Sulfurihydrogenibium azorense]ACN98835.1 MutS2 protein [Sulfurihydrogenibium azorense Az-Fu1]
MREKDLESIEYNKFLELLSSYTHNDLTKRHIINLRPFNNLEKLQKEIQKTKELYDLFIKKGYLPLTEYPDISQALNLAVIQDSILSPKDLFDIASLLKVVKEVKSYIDVSQVQVLKSLHQDLTPLRELEKAITDSIDNTFSVKDTASIDLSRIRKEIKEVESKINKVLESILNKPAYEEAIQEKIITIRRERFVIPIKYNYTHKIKGIILDRSSSGNTVYIEPFEVVPLNNKLSDLKLQEQIEIRKILKFLTDLVRSKVHFIKKSFEAILDFDILQAKVRYSKELDCIFPKQDEYLRLYNAKHPIFLLKNKPFNPIDIIVENKRGLIITGSNTGGKTVALKTAGLLSLLYKTAIPIPVDENSTVRVFDGVFIDIGDYQSIEENLSTFSYHVKNIKEILELSTQNSLLLFDELIPGTDPDFASALGIAILEYVREKGCFVIASTHLKKVKMYALSSDYYSIASVGFDKETLQPTYKIYYNTVGESMAFYIAQRLGLPEKILQIAKKYVEEDILKFQDMASNLSKMIAQYEEKIKEVEILKQQLQEEKQKYEELVRKLEQDRKEKWKESLKDIQDYIKNLKEEGYEILRQVKEEKSGSKLEKFIKTKKLEIQTIGQEEVNQEIKEGDAVRLKGKAQKGTVIAIRESKANVDFGGLKVWVDLSKIEKVSEEKKEEKQTVKVSKPSVNVMPSINLIGKTKEEAIKELEKYIDSILLQGLTTFKIIHGYGTGVLRKAVREYLDKLPYKVRYEDAPYHEGGMGATIVYLE